MTYIPENIEVPPGTIVAFGGIVAPTGWLMCNGQTVRRDDYPKLFLVVREYYGAGDGSTTFSLPDGRGRLFIGAGTGVGSNSDVGGTNSPPSGSPLIARLIGQWGGEETHTLTVPEMPSHDHSFSGGGGPDVYGITGPGSVYISNDGVTYPFNTYGSAVALGSGAVGYSGGGGAHNNLPPWQTVGGWIIKT